MSRRRKLVAVVGCLTAAAAGVFGLWTPASSAPAAVTTLTFFDPNGSGFLRYVDVGKKGLGNAGDYGLSVDPVYDAETCKRVGKRLSIFHLLLHTSKGGGYDFATGGLILRGGKLTLAFPTRLGEPTDGGGVGTVTGGTGDYLGARGEAIFTERKSRCGERGALLELHLVN